MSHGNGKTEKLTKEELFALTTPAKSKDRDERKDAVRRATAGLRVNVRVTPRLYGRD